jgi:integrase
VLYAGLRLGDLQALRVGDVDLDTLDAGLIGVERSWDVKAGVVEPTSRSGRRRVPIAGELLSPPG